MQVFDKIISDRGSRYAVSGGPAADRAAVAAMLAELTRVKRFQKATHHSWAAMARTGDKKHVEAMRFNNSVHMRVDKVESRCGTPVAQQAWFDVRQLQWHF